MTTHVITVELHVLTGDSIDLEAAMHELVTQHFNLAHVWNNCRTMYSPSACVITGMVTGVCRTERTPA